MKSKQIKNPTGPTKPRKKKHFYVYRIDVGDYFYYGYSHAPFRRLEDHRRKIKNVIKMGMYNMDSVPGYLKFHLVAAKYLALKRADYRESMLDSLRRLKLSVVFNSPDELSVMDVEQFLISKSLKVKECCNIREKSGGRMSCLIKHR